MNMLASQFLSVKLGISFTKVMENTTIIVILQWAVIERVALRVVVLWCGAVVSLIHMVLPRTNQRRHFSKPSTIVQRPNQTRLFVLNFKNYKQTDRQATSETENKKKRVKSKEQQTLTA